MNRSRILIILLISLCFAGCDKDNTETSEGRDVTQVFLSEYNGHYIEQTDRDDNGEQLALARNGDIEVLRIRDIGEEGNPITPPGTVCSYRLFGQVRYVVELNEESRQRIDENGEVYYAPQTHRMVFSVNDVELTNELHSGTIETPGCVEFETELNKTLPTYSYDMELFGPSIRLHTDGNDDFEDGKRGPGTLDEVYELQ